MRGIGHRFYVTVSDFFFKELTQMQQIFWLFKNKQNKLVAGENVVLHDNSDHTTTISADATSAVPHVTATVQVDDTTGTPSATVTRSGDDMEPNFDFAFSGLKGKTGQNGRDGTNGTNGRDGADGFSPTATVTQTSTGADISITDKNGTTTASVHNGTDGTNGTDGVTPSITATASVATGSGTPAVVVTKTGTDATPNFDFAFSNMPSGGGTAVKHLLVVTPTAWVERNLITPADGIRVLGSSVTEPTDFTFYVYYTEIGDVKIPTNIYFKILQLQTISSPPQIYNDINGYRLVFTVSAETYANFTSVFTSPIFALLDIPCTFVQTKPGDVGTQDYIYPAKITRINAIGDNKLRMTVRLLNGENIYNNYPCITLPKSQQSFKLICNS